MGILQKKYLAKRKRVEDALMGLVFGFPNGGLVNLEGVSDPHLYVRYSGKNHIDGVVLNGRYFLYCPNPWYHDVQIDHSRINTLPLEESLINLPSFDPSSDDDTPDDGPAKHQFDVLDENEEMPHTRV